MARKKLKRIQAASQLAGAMPRDARGGHVEHGGGPPAAEAARGGPVPTAGQHTTQDS